MNSFENIKEIVIASNNKGKIKMVQEILSDYKIIPMTEKGIDIDVVEDANTFEGNAIKKAETIANMLENTICLADDSGIEVEYLNGFPGVETKRWFKGTDRERNLALIKKLDGVEKNNRKVKFKVAMALSTGNETITAESWIDGYITENPRGENGFGFDEIFELENGKTLAELTVEEKNEIGVRKEVLEILKMKLS
ncbi:MAG: non-canonical purine NTP pyrophosphatase [Clostridia bacterium]|nr:non-canonical purine NTP pyrophosphatase [Clostridia bacterium]